MKKLILLALVITTGSSVFAQKSFRFGLQGTGGLSWFQPDTRGIENNGLRLNYNFGLMTDFAISGENYYFSTGVNMATLSGKLKYPDLVYPTKDSVDFSFATANDIYNLNYVELPLMLKMRTNEIGYMHYFGMFGISAGMNTRARLEQKHSYSGGTLEQDEEIDIADEIRLFRVGLNVGFGVEYNLTGETMAVAALTYHNGLTNIFNDTYYELDEDDKSKVALDEDNLIETSDGSGVFIPYTAKEGPKWKSVAHNIQLTIGIFF